MIFPVQQLRINCDIIEELGFDMSPHKYLNLKSVLIIRIWNKAAEDHSITNRQTKDKSLTVTIDCTRGNQYISIQYTVIIEIITTK